MNCAHCGAPLPPQKRGMRRKHCDDRCKSRANYARHHVARSEALRGYRSTVLGRVCKYCACTDAERGFGSSRICSRCARMLYRSVCKICGGPWYATVRGDRPIGCVVRSRIPYGTSCKDEVA